MRVRALVDVVGVIFGGVEKLCTYLAAIIIMGLMFLMVIDVVGRKLFNAPLSGTTDIAEITLVGVVYLSISYVQRLKDHVNVDLFVRLLPPAPRVGLEVFGLVLACFMSALITWGSARFAWESLLVQDYTMGIARVPIWPAKLVVTVGFALLSLRLLRDVVEALLRVLRAQGEAGTPRER